MSKVKKEKIITDLTWTNNKQTYKFISMIKMHDILYDETIFKKYGKDAKLEIWKRLAYDFTGKSDEATLFTLKRKWKLLRDSFKKSYRTYMAKKNNGLEAKDPAHYKAMKFLVPHLKITDANSDTNSMLVDQKSESINDDSEKIATDEYMSENNVDHALATINSYSSFNGYDQSNNDETEEFFHCLARTLKRLKPLNQALAKKTIANIILDMEIKEARDAEKIKDEII